MENWRSVDDFWTLQSYPDREQYFTGSLSTTLPIKIWTAVFKFLNYIQETVSPYKISAINFQPGL